METGGESLSKVSVVPPEASECPQISSSPSDYIVLHRKIKHTISSYVKKYFPKLSSSGKYCKSSVPVVLSKAEEDYEVKVVKHIFDGHVVLEYKCSHKIPGISWKNVHLTVDIPEEPKHLQVKSKFIPSLPQNLQRRTYVAFKMPDGVMSARFSHTLSFVVEKADSSDSENKNIEEKVEYKLKDLEFFVSDYIEKMSKDFGKEWRNIGQNRERDYEFEYQPVRPYNSLSDALKVVNNLLSMHPCEGTEVVPEDATSHTCLLAGKFLGMVMVLVKATIEFDNIEFTSESTDTKSVRLKLTCRCDDICVGIYIHRMVVNWLKRHTLCCGWDEYIYDSYDSEDDGEPLSLIVRI